MSVGNQYLYYDDAIGWDYDGYFQFDSMTEPTTVTFSKNDYNFNAVFPVTDNYSGTINATSFITAFYTSSEGVLAIVLRLAMTPISSTDTTVTYQVLAYSVSNAADFSSEDSFSMLFRYPEAAATGPTGATGSTGAPGVTGSVGPTGASAPIVQVFNTSLPAATTITVPDSTSTLITEWRTSGTTNQFSNSTNGGFTGGVYTFSLPASQWWRVNARLEYSAGAVGRRDLELSLNGGAPATVATVTTDAQGEVAWSGNVNVSNGDTLAVYAYQESGEDLDLDSTDLGFNGCTLSLTQL